MGKNEARGFHVVVQDHRTDEVYNEFCYIHPRDYRGKPFDLELELLQMSFVAEHCPAYLWGYHGEPDCDYSQIWQDHDARVQEERIR